MMPVARGQTTEAEIVVDAGTELVVRVTNEANRPVRVDVSVTDGGGREFAHMDTIQGAREGWHGDYSFEERRVGPLAPGNYTVLVRTDDGREKRAPVTVKGEPETTVQIELND